MRIIELNSVNIKGGKTIPPILPSDMVQVLLYISEQSPKLKKSHDIALYVKAERALMKTLFSVPSIYKKILELESIPRIYIAIELLDAMGLIQIPSINSNNSNLLISDSGREWLLLDEKSRFCSIVAGYKEEVNQLAQLSDNHFSIWPNFFDLDLAGYDFKQIQKYMIDEIGKIEFEKYYPIDVFMQYFIVERNYFVEQNKLMSRDPFDIDHFFDSFDVTDVNYAYEVWQQFTISFIFTRLLLVGGVKLCEMEDGTPAIAFTSITEYILGGVKKLNMDVLEGDHVIVQPNFEIVFLTPLIAAEYQIGRFADRIGHYTGVLFKITKQSILKGAQNGLRFEDVIGWLNKYSKNVLPKNIVREIEGWFSLCIQVSLKNTMVLKCENIEVVKRVVSILPKDIEIISDTVVLIHQIDNRKQIEKKMANHGVFVIE